MEIISWLALLAWVALTVWLVRKCQQVNRDLRLAYEAQEEWAQKFFDYRDEAAKLQAEMRINHRADEDVWVERIHEAQEETALARRALVVQVLRQEGVPLAEIA